MKKKRSYILLFVFTLILCMGFYSKVSAQSLYECEYVEKDSNGKPKADSKTETHMKLTIEANQALDYKAYMDKFEKMTVQTSAVSIANWLNYNDQSKSIVYQIGALGCPKYAAVVPSSTTIDTNTGFKVWLNWTGSKSINHCSGKEKCKNLVRKSNPEPETKVCYYKKDGTLTTNKKESLFMAFKTGNKKVAITASNTEANSLWTRHELKKDSSDFFSSKGKLDCLDTIYMCGQITELKADKALLTDEAYKILVFTKEDYKNKSSDCTDDLTTTINHIQETVADQKGMTIDDWLPKTEGPTAEECRENPDQKGCAKSSCEVISTSGETFKILKQVISYLQIGSVFAVLVLCILDFGGAIASSDDDAFRKARGKVMKRIIALVLIFLVPLLVNFVINLVNLGACSEEDYDFIGNLFH